MGRWTVSDKEKATPESISLKPKHKEMLNVLTTKLRTSKSKLVQKLIEQEFKERGHSL